MRSITRLCGRNSGGACFQNMDLSIHDRCNSRVAAGIGNLNRRIITCSAGVKISITISNVVRSGKTDLLINLSNGCFEHPGMHAADACKRDIPEVKESACINENVYLRLRGEVGSRIDCDSRTADRDITAVHTDLFNNAVIVCFVNSDIACPFFDIRNELHSQVGTFGDIRCMCGWVKTGNHRTSQPFDNIGRR